MEDETETKKRVADFLDRYGKLVEELKVDFANYPVYIPDGQGGFRTIIQSTPVDTSKMAVPSKFMGD